MMLSGSPISFVRAVHQDAKRLLMDRVDSKDRQRVSEELDELCVYTESCVRDCHSPNAIDKTVHGIFQHDVLSWSQGSMERPLSDFRLQDPVLIKFGFSNRNQMILKDAFKRYGDDRDAIVKLIQRIGKSPTRDPITGVECPKTPMMPNTERRGFFHRGH